MTERTAIVIDDDKEINLLLAEILTISGYEVSGAGFNGDDAVSLYKKFKPTVVLLDVRMPKKNGFDALEEIKQFDPLAIVVMVTGEAESQAYDRLQSLGASAIVYKPFDVDRLVKVIDKAIKSDKMIVQ